MAWREFASAHDEMPFPKNAVDAEYASFYSVLRGNLRKQKEDVRDLVQRVERGEKESDTARMVDEAERLRPDREPVDGPMPTRRLAWLEIERRPRPATRAGDEPRDLPDAEDVGGRERDAQQREMARAQALNNDGMTSKFKTDERPEGAEQWSGGRDPMIHNPVSERETFTFVNEDGVEVEAPSANRHRTAAAWRDASKTRRLRGENMEVDFTGAPTHAFGGAEGGNLVVADVQLKRENVLDYSRQSEGAGRTSRDRRGAQREVIVVGRDGRENAPLPPNYVDTKLSRPREHRDEGLVFREDDDGSDAALWLRRVAPSNRSRIAASREAYYSTKDDSRFSKEKPDRGNTQYSRQQRAFGDTRYYLRPDEALTTAAPPNAAPGLQRRQVLGAPEPRLHTSDRRELVQEEAARARTQGGFAYNSAGYDRPDEPQRTGAPREELDHRAASGGLNARAGYKQGGVETLADMSGQVTRQDVSTRDVTHGAGARGAVKAAPLLQDVDLQKTVLEGGDRVHVRVAGDGRLSRAHDPVAESSVSRRADAEVCDRGACVTRRPDQSLGRIGMELGASSFEKKEVYVKPPPTSGVRVGALREAAALGRMHGHELSVA